MFSVDVIEIGFILDNASEAKKLRELEKKMKKKLEREKKIVNLPIFNF